MKKTATLLFFLITLSGFAQTYFPMLNDSVNRWEYSNNFLPIRAEQPSVTALCTYPINSYLYLIEQTVGDTSIVDSISGMHSYKKIESTWDFNSSFCSFGFVREDSIARKVYFKDNVGNNEILLYDFSLQVGDTFNPVVTYCSPYYAAGAYILDSITTTTIQAGQRRVFWLNIPNSIQQPMKWIESVGAVTSVFYSYAALYYSPAFLYDCNTFQQSTPYDCAQFLTCFSHQQKVFIDLCAYQQVMTNGCFFLQDSCNYWNICGVVNEHSSIGDFSVYPNPSNGNFTVGMHIKSAVEVSVHVYNLFGQEITSPISFGKIADGNAEKQISLSALAGGYYLVELRTKDGSAWNKIMIEE
jgi:hypothetical protein